MKCNVQAEVNRNHSTSPGTLSPQQLSFHVVPLYYYKPATSLVDDLKTEVHTEALQNTQKWRKLTVALTMQMLLYDEEKSDEAQTC